MVATAYTYFQLEPGGKKPITEAWQNTKQGAGQKLVGNRGIALQADDLIIDIDPRNFRPGVDTLEKLATEHSLPATYTVKTPGGGLHLYFKKPPEIRVRRKLAKMYPGADFLSSGAYVVAPGSSVDGKDYLVHADVDVAEIPESLLILLMRNELVSTAFADITDDGALSGYVAWLRTSEPAVEGSGGDQLTFRTACEGKVRGLDKQTVFAAMWEHFNPRCVPPWGMDELEDKVENAFAYSQDRQGSKAPAADFANTDLKAVTGQTKTSGPVIELGAFKILKEQGVQFNELEVDKNNKAKATFGNCEIILQRDDMFNSAFAWDAFSNEVKWIKLPFWRAQAGDASPQVNGVDYAQIRGWYSRKTKITFSKPDIEDAIGSRASQNRMHPLEDWLNSLEWDGKPRIDMAFHELLGVEDNLYTRIVSANFFKAAVKRGIEPGCKQDYTVVLESGQGLKKSQWVQLVGGEYYATFPIDLSTASALKDVYQALRGKWIIEVQELDHVTRKADVAKLKAFLSTETDRYRDAYGKLTKDWKRTCMFMATVNPGASGYLRDETGNRRYLPVTIKNIDLHKTELNREQLFAEALHRIKAGELYWSEDPAYVAMAIEEQRLRMERDIFSDLLHNWLSTRLGDNTPFSLVEACHSIGLRAGTMNQYDRRRVTNALLEQGWEYNYALRLYSRVALGIGDLL